jgi:hypothetical protein
MITGVNTLVPVGGTDYHVQIEDLDGERVLEARVYVGGRILFQKRQDYGPLLEGAASPQEVQERIRGEMERLLALLKAAIERGRIRA